VSETTILGCLGVVFLFLLFIVVGGVAVSFAWNETMPYIFELPRITWQQGSWLTVLSWFLFKPIANQMGTK
jgi:hypothetical protein